MSGVKNKSLIWYFVVPFILVLLFKLINQQNSSNQKDNYKALAQNVSTTGEKLVPETVDYIFDVKPILSDRCYLCHGPDEGTREAGLRLDTKEGAFALVGRNRDLHAIVPGDTASSRMVYRITNKDPEKIMPPVTSNLSLTEYEKKVLIKWIKQGATWKEHWAFIPPKKAEVPVVSDNSFVNNPIDNFIIEKLEKNGLSPSAKATKESLIRRVYFDITGLPPTIEDIDSFLADKSPNAYEKVVDKLLGSPAYGERMASDWLDVARYADTHGYQDDLERIMWPWRDWVIHAYNKNLPYDEFIKWQLAGDLIPDASLEQIVATGFNRNHKITQEGGVIDEEYRVEYVMDRTNTTAKAIMGLTMECARCHDHKYDPISQEDFYGFYGFFNKVKEKGRIEYDEIPEPNVSINADVVIKDLPFINLPDTIKEVKLMVMEDGAADRKTYKLNRGVYDGAAEEVELTTPKAILNYDNKLPKNRLGLAEWFFDKENSLTARVAVNRLWQQFFGVGIVATSDDFGNQGDLPTHPELLDWLAVTYREIGWDTKAMIKLMVMSHTYQQSSRVTPEQLELDPENKWLARSSRNKLTAEMIRDNTLAVSGLLVNKIGGPSVKPYQPKGLWAETTSGQGLTKYLMDKGENQYRRSLYTFWKRTVPPPSMVTFDAATRDFCEVKRQKTSTPLQALVMLNDPQLLDAAQNMAFQVLSNESLSDKERIDIIFRKITSRHPDELELERLQNYFEEVNNSFNAEKKELVKDKLQKFENSKIDAQQFEAYTMLTSMIFNLDEAIVKG